MGKRQVTQLVRQYTVIPPSKLSPPSNLILTPPNVLTTLRMMVSPIIAFTIINPYILVPAAAVTAATTATAAATAATAATTTTLNSIAITTLAPLTLPLTIVSSASDFIDGALARANPLWSTKLGSYLDPISDKIFVGLVGFSLFLTNTIPGAVVGTWIARDVILAGNYAFISKSGTGFGDENSVVEPSLISKVNTTLQMSTLMVALAGWSADPLRLRQSGSDGLKDKCVEYLSTSSMQPLQPYEKSVFDKFANFIGENLLSQNYLDSYTFALESSVGDLKVSTTTTVASLLMDSDFPKNVMVELASKSSYLMGPIDLVTWSNFDTGFQALCAMSVVTSIVSGVGYLDGSAIKSVVGPDKVERMRVKGIILTKKITEGHPF